MYSIRYSIGYRVFNEVYSHLTLSTPFAPSISNPFPIHLLNLAPSLHLPLHLRALRPFMYLIYT